MPQDDLAGRLLAAIEETERIAHAAGGEAWHRPDPIALPSLIVGQDEHIVSYDEEDAESPHIVRHDPAAVLRRCAADRRIVGAYSEAVTALHDAPLHARPFVDAHLSALKVVLRELSDGYGLDVEENGRG